jgi:hypothetical protein
MKIFGFEIRKTQTETGSFVPPRTEDGTIDQVVGASGAAAYGYAFDVEGRFKSEAEQIQKYRAMSQTPEIDLAVEEITSESIIIEDDKPPLSLNVFAQDNEIPKNLKQTIVTEFDNVISILNLNSDGHDLFRRWYVDGRFYGHIVVDENNIADGIKDIRPLDPRKTKKMREIVKQQGQNGLETIVGIEEYFIYSDKGVSSGDNSTGVRLSSDVLVYAPSGLVDANNNVISFLHKAIKPYNQLRYMEDAALIYALSRAPQRQVFYIDVADMPKQKAEQYVQDIMNRYKNKIVYDAASGELRGDQVHTSITENYWLPRRNSGRTTEITTLPGDNITSQMDNIMYFMNKLYSSLNLPQSRVKADQSGFNLGRASEITRDEVKFGKFISRLRLKFSEIPLQALRVQLILKGIISPEDWEFIKSKIRVEYQRDNYFAELKEAEILQGRIALAEAIQPFIGTVFSMNYLKRQIFRLTDDDIMNMEEDEFEQEMEQQNAQSSQPNPNQKSQGSKAGNSKSSAKKGN